MKQSLLKKLWLRTSMLVAVILCGAGTAWGQTVAKIGDVTYETLEAAFAAAQDGATVTMLTDVTLAGNLVLALEGKAVTLDLNKKTLKGRTNLTSGSLTVMNGTVNCEGGQPLNVYGSATEGAENHSVLTVAEDVNVSGNYGVCLFGAPGAKDGYGAVANIAGTVSGKEGTVFVSGNLGNNIAGDMNNVINITGKVYGNEDAAVALNGNATVNVKSGAEITGNTGIAVKRGVLNVEDGATVHGTGAENLTPGANNNGTEMTGAAVSMTDTYNNYGAMSVNITGGTFTSDKTVALFKEDGTYANAATYAVSGGTFSSAVPAEFCAEGYIPADLGDGKYGVKAGAYVAQVDNVSYETLEAAFAAAQDGATVTMLTDVTLAGNLVLALEGKAVTLDLGGKTLNGRTNLTSGSLTVMNGTVNCEGGQPLNVYGSATAGAKDYSVLTIAEDVTVSGAYGVCLFGPTYTAKAGYGAVINVAGTLNGTDGTVFVSGNLGNNIAGDMNNVINITGKVYGNNDAGVALNGNATVNVKSGAEITGNTGIAVKRGVLNVEDGATVHGTGAENQTPDANNNGTEMTGAAVSMTDTYNNYGAMAVNITGGTFTSDHAAALFKKDGTYANAATFAVSGGTFSSPVPAEFCAQGYIPADLGDGKYGVKEGVFVAQIGDVKYETLDDAVAAVPDNGAEPTLITLLCDVENGNGIKTVATHPKNVVIDFDGHTYRVGKGLVGSSGTENQSWHLEKGSKFELKNGTLTSSLAAMLIQNYCDLTLTDMQVGSADDSYNYVVSNNCGSLNVNGSTSITAPAGKTAFDVCATNYYPEGVTVTVNTTGTITGAIEYDVWNTKPEDNKAKLDIQAGNFNISWKVEDALAEDAKKNLNVYGGTFNVPVPADYCAQGYIPADLGEGKYGVKLYISTPIIFHDSGEYEEKLTVTIAGENVKYTLNDGEAQTYTAPINITANTTIKAWTELDGATSDVVTREYTIVEKAKGAVVEDGYYTIQTNGVKYVNVAGRKTVTLVNDTKSAGTVIRVKADEDGVKVLRSQAVDLPRYAERAMSYVPEIVKEVVNKLAGNVDDPIIGEQGTQLILDKFNKEFDYHLYLEGENNTYRIYGRTPSMKPVVDFYAENKELIDGRLLKVEGFVKEVLQKVVDKVERGQSVVDMFKVKTIWQNMGGTLTEPTDDASTLKFYEEVLSSEKNVWEFAYQTGMLYWEKVKGYLKENAGSLGDYGKYLEKIPNVRPNFKYYIVPGENGVDIISEGNSQITDASTAWTLTKREGFDITFDANLSKNNGKEMYKSLYVDFAYELPENVKALKVKSVTDAGVAETEEIKGVVPAQTPVLLKSTDAENLTKTLTLSVADGAAVESELKGNDWLINKFNINTPALETMFAMLTKLSSSLGNKYEYLKRKNAGTVNNKYFFGLSVPTDDGEFKEAFMNGKVKVLGDGEKGLGFYSNFDKDLVGNEVFVFTDDANPIPLTLVGDINRDGSITIADVTALVNIILGKATPEKDSDKYDFDAAYVNDDNVITIADVTALVNIILGK